MNPYNQQYPYNYQQHTPGPPQPSWQAPPRRGWGDPRPGGQQQPPGPQSPVSPYQSGPVGYYPPPPPPPPPLGAPYTPPGAQQSNFDTSRWGVKYNQSPQGYPQQQEQRPPLPPRPTSAASHPSPTPEQANTASQWQQTYGAPPAPPQQQTQWQDPYYQQNQQQQPQSYDIPPPPPPPRPPQYQTQNQSQYQQPQIPHDQYSHQPPTHHYDPPSQYNESVPQQPSHYPSSSIASLPPKHQPTTENAPVSPIGPNDANFYSSALGTGGPSDWEHFGNAPSGMSPDAESPDLRMGATATPGFDTPMQPKPQPTLEKPVQDTANATFESPAPMHAILQGHERIPSIHHRDSDQSSVITDGMKRTDTIDSVMQAWATPLRVAPKALPSGAQAVPQVSSQIVPPPGHERIVEVEKVVEKIVDPYDDLEPEIKASLKRYATMLRKESAADTDDEKFSIFEAFITKELRLRSMMYGIEPRLQMAKHEKKSSLDSRSPGNTNLADAVMGISLRDAQSVGDKFEPTAVSASDAANLAPKPPLADTQAVPRSQPNATSVAVNSSSVPSAPASIPQPEPPRAMDPIPEAVQPVQVPRQTSPVLQAPRPPTPPPIQVPTKDVSPQSKDDFVMVNAGDDEPEYSPGGRPKVRRPTQIKTSTKAPSPPKPQPAQMSPSANAPMVLEDYVMPGPPSPGANAPMIVEPISTTDLPQVVTPNTSFQRSASGQSVGSKQSSTPILKFEPARTAYTPFKYNANVEQPRLPADKSYSSLRSDAVDSGRLLVHKASVPDALGVGPERSSTPSRKTDEAFIGLIRSQSKAVRKKTPDLAAGPIAALRPGTPARAPTPAQTAPPPKANNIGSTTIALRRLLPATIPDSYGLSEHTKANAVKDSLDNVPDSFGWINETVLAWDRKNREVRKRLDDERSARQAESEQHVDDLFNDNEIGYADIGELENEFKLAEAERKYQEDQQELDSFTQGVYVPVTERMAKELAELNAQYTIAVDLLDLDSEPASRMLKSSNSKAEMAFVMSCVLSAFNKLELRHQKIAEANVERERRRKRLELTVLYTNGDTAGVKSLEAEFAVAEKMQVLHEARGKDTRANKLLDTYDRATVRGLGDNQTYVDDLLVRVRELKELILKEGIVPESVYQPDGPRDSLLLAQKTVDFILADSQKLLTISNVADKMLNEADFAVSVAEAKVSNAGSEVYDKLAGEKEKEDAKIVEDTNSRMASIARGPEEASVLIREVVDRVGGDEGHKERIKAALEAAKRRNEGREGDGLEDFS